MLSTEARDQDGILTLKKSTAAGLAFCATGMCGEKGMMHLGSRANNREHSRVGEQNTGRANCGDVYA